MDATIVPVPRQVSIWNMNNQSILFSWAEPSTRARNADLHTEQTEAPEVSEQHQSFWILGQNQLNCSEKQFCIELHKEDKEIESGVVWGFFPGVLALSVPLLL